MENVLGILCGVNVSRRAPAAGVGGAVCHSPVVLCNNQAQNFGEGTRLSVLGKLQNQGGGDTVP